MTRKLTRFFLPLVALLWALPAVAQTTVTQTTLSAAQSATATTASLTSATGVLAGSGLFIDREYEFVISISGTTATVVRNQQGTGGAPAGGGGGHASGAIVWVDPDPTNVTRPGPFVYADPALGSCTLTSELWSVRVNINNGYVWACQNSKWAVLRDVPPVQASAQSVGAAVASATTITPTGGIFHVTGTTAIATINVPAGCDPGCQVTIVPDALGSTTAAGNISLATTFVVNKALVLTWDGTKWNPSY